MSARAALLVLLAGAGCRSVPPDPEDEALERYEEADRLYGEGRHAEAAPLYASVIASRDRIKDAYFKLAACHEKLGRRDEAAAVMERWLRVDPQDEAGRRELARIRKDAP